MKANYIDVRYTTQEERDAINEAKRLIDIGDDDYVMFRSNGWDGPYRGVYKRAYIKNGIVVKYGPEHQLAEEVRLWKSTRYGKFRKYRRNFARVYGIYKGWMIQRQVPNNYRSCSRKCGEVAHAVGLADWTHNHYHDIKGNPVWFDSVL